MAAKNKKFEKFVKDMEKAGIETVEYQRYQNMVLCRNPAVLTNEKVTFQDIMGATKVKLQWDNLDDLGIDRVVYPI